MIQHKGHEGHKGKTLTALTLVSLVSLVFIVSAQNAPAPRTLDKGDRSNIHSTRMVVLRTADEWQALWAQHAPERQRPAVDFSREMVVGVFLGTKPTAAYGVAVLSTIDGGGALLVKYRVAEPPSGTITAQVITYPYHLAAVPIAKSTDVRFEKVP